METKKVTRKRRKPPKVVPVDRISISPSTIDAADCPWYFKKEFDRKALGTEQDDALTPVNLLVGRFAHQVVEKYTKSLKEKGRRSDPELFNGIFDAVWKYNEFIPESHYEEIKAWLTSFAEYFELPVNAEGELIVWRAEEPIALDWNLQRVEWDSPKKWLRVKLDRIDVREEDSLGIITDYKTARWVPGEAELKRSLQAIVYPWVLHQINPTLVNFRVIFEYIRYNKKVIIDYSIDELRMVEWRLRSFTERWLEKINDPATEFPALVGSNCPICRYTCPLLEKGIEPIKNDEVAQVMGMKVQAHRDEIERLMDQLKLYCKATEGEIDIGIGKYGFTLNESLRGIKVDPLLTWCNDNFIDPNLVVSFDSKKFKKLSSDSLKEQIKGMGKVQVNTRFGFKASGKDEDE